MNKIKSFADDAAKYSAIQYLPSGKDGNELFIEYFTELIIKECSTVMENEDSYYGSWMSKVIKQHFGVK